MNFRRIDPDPRLKNIIDCYWTVESEDPIPVRQKIIPDGFVEIIFHFGDPYRICFDEQWELQSNALLAGQINRHFFLENTGMSSILGIKLSPTAIAKLFPLSMDDYTDRVVDLSRAVGDAMYSVETAIREKDTHHDRISCLNAYFKNLCASKHIDAPIDDVVDRIISSHGLISVKDLVNLAGVGERQLENLFSRYVGLSPKRFARIIRFNYIFDLVRRPPHTWSDVAFEAAYYDQSHFIRNFREFTGENPADYSFDEQNMANFFINRK